MNQISTEKIINLEVTDQGKIVVLTGGNVSKIYIYKEETYEEENCIILESEVNSFVIDSQRIYCALSDNSDNILIMHLEDTDRRYYLNGHSCSVTGVAITNYGYLLSADISGKVVVWKDNEVKKLINDFLKKINTISVINEEKQRIAILSFNSQEVKFYDLRYTKMEPLAKIGNIIGSGFQNNMLKLNSNILAIAGTYIYIIDINSFLLTNIINCSFANDSISTSLTYRDNKGYFFVSQALTNQFNNNIEKGTIGYYEYEFVSDIIPDRNPLTKVGSEMSAHNNFITSIKFINSDTLVSGSYDGKIKFWSLE